MVELQFVLFRLLSQNGCGSGRVALRDVFGCGGCCCVVSARAGRAANEVAAGPGDGARPSSGEEEKRERMRFQQQRTYVPEAPQQQGQQRFRGPDEAHTGAQEEPEVPLCDHRGRRIYQETQKMYLSLIHI